MQDASETEPEPEPSSSTRTQENNPKNGTPECSICGRSKSSTSVMDLSANNVMQRRLNRDWKLPTDTIKATLQAICVECVCKLNMHSEVTRSIMQRLQRLTKANVSVAEPKSQAKQCSPPIADAEVSTTGGSLPLEDIAADAVDVASATTSSSCSALQAYSAQPPESPSATESGGMHTNNGNALDGWRWRTRLVCQHCERAYFRKDLYTLHVRRCWRRQTQRHRKCRVLNEAGNDDDAVENVDFDGQTLTQVPRNSRTFQCRNCEKEFAGIVAMRQHQRTTHQSQHRCSLCEADFTTKYEWELHHTICSAKQEALQLQEVATTRSTRSRSRACSLAWYNNENEDEDEEEDDRDGEGEEDPDDDATSVADTMYTRRMNFTGDWIVNHSRSNSNSAINLTMLYDDYVLDESQITTDKEYDLYLLDLLKTQVQLKAFSCFVPNCCYQTDTLVDLMKHDYMQHWKMSWFYCHKCGDVFTSKVFLDYHLHRQNRGFYICHKCHDEFEFQHQLERHQVLHSKGINYHCNYCRLEFLSEAKLLAHCEHERHSPNDEPPLICIDHALSISNPVPKEPIKVRQYSMRVLDIPQIPWHSNRPMHLPQHKPFRFAIGICEFDNRNPPNCVGCL